MENNLPIIVFALALHNLATGHVCPTMVSRSEWGAKNTSSTNLTTFPPSHIVMHHAVSPSCSTKSTCSALARAFQKYHMDTNKWDDIGYNFLVGGDGLVYEGRGWGKTGAHAIAYNSHSIGICFIGTFTSSLPNSTALRAAKELISCGVAEGQIDSNYTLIGHRQVSATECPGRSLYMLMQTWSHWSSSP